MTFNLFETVNQCKPAKVRGKTNTQKQFVSKHQHQINDHSNAIVVSFSYKPENKPNLDPGKIIHNLKQIVDQYPLSCPPRSYQHKFYLNFVDKPTKQLLYMIQKTMQHAYPNCKVFTKYDKISQRDKSTVYVGKMLGVSKEMLEEYLREKLHIKFKDVRVVYDKETQKPKNFGYIECYDPETAQQIVSELSGIKLGLSDGLKVVMMVDE